VSFVAITLCISPRRVIQNVSVYILIDSIRKFLDTTSYMLYHAALLGMERPRVADGGDSHQIWRVAVNMLNKKSRSADEKWSSDLGVR
jgi:hypothetical protein